MAANVRDETIPRSMMLLFLGAAAVLIVVQWRSWATSPAPSPKTASTNKEIAAEVKATSQAPAQFPAEQPANISPEMGTVKAVSTDLPKADISTSLVVDLSDRKVSLYKGKQLKVSYPIAVGQEGWETPTGKFKVMEMQRDPKWLHPITKEVVLPGPDNPLGKRWIGFWSDGKTHLGFHGTNQEELIGQAVSHGCLRMRNKDVIALFNQVSMGTSVTVRK